MSRLLDIDPLSGAVETMTYDHATKGLVITRVNDNIDAVLDANAESYNDAGQGWRGQNNDFWHVARIPVDVLEMWRLEFNLGKPRDQQVLAYFDDRADFQSFVWGRLNSNEYRKLRTAPVKV